MIGLLLLVFFAASLTVCTIVQEGEVPYVNCPACGYEFDAPPEGK